MAVLVVASLAIYRLVAERESRRVGYGEGEDYD